MTPSITCSTLTSCTRYTRTSSNGDVSSREAQPCQVSRFRCSSWHHSDFLTNIFTWATGTVLDSTRGQYHTAASARTSLYASQRAVHLSREVAERGVVEFLAKLVPCSRTHMMRGSYVPTSLRSTLAMYAASAPLPPPPPLHTTGGENAALAPEFCCFFVCFRCTQRRHSRCHITPAPKCNKDVWQPQPARGSKRIWRSGKRRQAFCNVSTVSLPRKFCF